MHQPQFLSVILAIAACAGTVVAKTTPLDPRELATYADDAALELIPSVKFNKRQVYADISTEVCPELRGEEPIKCDDTACGGDSNKPGFCNKMKTPAGCRSRNCSWYCFCTGGHDGTPSAWENFTMTSGNPGPKADPVCENKDLDTSLSMDQVYGWAKEFCGDSEPTADAEKKFGKNTWEEPEITFSYKKAEDGTCQRTCKGSFKDMTNACQVGKVIKGKSYIDDGCGSYVMQVTEVKKPEVAQAEEKGYTPGTCQARITQIRGSHESIKVWEIKDQKNIVIGGPYDRVDAKGEDAKFIAKSKLPWELWVWNRKGNEGVEFSYDGVHFSTDPEFKEKIESDGAPRAHLSGWDKLGDEFADVGDGGNNRRDMDIWFICN